MRKYIIQFSIRNILKNPFRNNPKISKVFNDCREYTIDISRKYFRFVICFLIAFAFIELFSLFKEPNYDDIINYGERGTILIATLAFLTFSYADELDSLEKKAVVEIGKNFFKSVLNFVVGLIFLIGFREPLFNPSRISIFPDILSILSLVIIFILFFTGFVMLIMSAVYLGIGINDLTKTLSKSG